MRTTCSETDLRRKLEDVFFCVCAGVRRKNLRAGEGLSGVAVSDGAGRLPDRLQHLQPPPEPLQRGQWVLSSESRLKNVFQDFI